jgi:hypothetical protein
MMNNTETLRACESINRCCCRLAQNGNYKEAYKHIFKISFTLEQMHFKNIHTTKTPLCFMQKF